MQGCTQLYVLHDKTEPGAPNGYQATPASDIGPSATCRLVRPRIQPQRARDLVWLALLPFKGMIYHRVLLPYFVQQPRVVCSGDDLASKFIGEIEMNCVPVNCHAICPPILRPVCLEKGL